MQANASAVPPLQLLSSPARAVSIPASPKRLTKPNDWLPQLSVNPKEQLLYPLPDTSPKPPPNTPTENSKFNLGVFDLFPRPPTQKVVHKQAVNPHAALQETLQCLQVRDPPFTSIQYTSVRRGRSQHTIEASQPQVISDMAKQSQASKVRRGLNKIPRMADQKHQGSISCEGDHRSRSPIDNRAARPESGTIPVDQLPKLITKHWECEKGGRVEELRRVSEGQRAPNSTMNAALPSPEVYRLSPRIRKSSFELLSTSPSLKTQNVPEETQIESSYTMDGVVDNTCDSIHPRTPRTVIAPTFAAAMFTDIHT
ncbi:hypothetical protein TWF970_010789 [Orbilia oligospora]|uniref:Uncharacterized protein n=1 Tax=Orbilia oligospora TaxID=2813651 RepID=A0A7C8VHC5_ORBOL|nr:hypothetical protein TWF970_010789 [Orbilia oligospora]